MSEEFSEESRPVFTEPRLSESDACEIDRNGTKIRTFAEIVFDADVEGVEYFLETINITATASRGRYKIQISSRFFNPGKNKLIDVNPEFTKAMELESASKQ